mgnify:CR=1 FL=1
MVPRINRILYATDLSENAKHAFGYAADLAQKYDAKMTILYVMEQMNHLSEIHVRDMMGEEQWKRIQDEKLDYLTDKIQTRLNDFCTEMDNHIDACSVLVDDIQILKGNPTEQILNQSREVDADLIVMGSYGHNIIQGALIGGTARKVVQSSEIPVLVVRLPKSG